MSRPSSQAFHDRLQEVRYEESLYWKDLLRKRDEWIVELIREGDAARAVLRRAVKEAIPDAMIFAAHTDSNRYRKALEDLRQWTVEAKAVLDAEDRRNGYPPDAEKAASPKRDGLTTLNRP